MYVYNITFLASKADTDEIAGIIRSDVIPAVRRDGGNLRLQMVDEMPGMGAEEASEMAVSIALQMEFPDKESLRQWERAVLSPVLDAYRRRLGQRGLYFPSVLKVLPLG